MIFVMLIIYFILLISIRMQMHKAQKMSRTSSKDIKLILISLLVIGVFCGVSYEFNIRYNYKYSYVIGVGILYLISLFIHRKALKDLGGQNWADSSIPRDGAELVTTGLYSVIRHPIYLAFILEGISVSLASPYFIGVGICECSLCFYRIKFSKEEEYLEKRYGNKYIKYKEKVKYRIIPYIY
ncbi:protein-S-isoprenylcysteine methyltransferase [Clostridium acetobutylicum EA 2018]|uniref:Isoprenylcysteine carboxylmethyltransferase family protein n=3 Tax=Clostridiaceae TaxID=31979 RepID=Q97DR0_CLOAB|nr:isoprenylcysteine carboxylmethyltransferase family protein [Clostridium acetobutylicum]AAK81342.1 Predicted protein-S-isoprenylcysteine methyltransferase [Clostridium acetobutylicum ATCC 824]ADZ22452.1 protein-S-isoprenylcysteine methyltransferase [Clostridium acetobutylicum EA 2018]PSM05578.1 isoprenylcysteine carboxylmethyltransferase family protein [Clostridium sp. NJ4]AEI32830.1 protein-S-isoprenylcysteine methyltransferase [Clostridium acetobutylicum DSM 1731]AWV80991.1 isoprenylcystei